MPTYLVILIVGLNSMLALTVLWTSLCAINEMNRRTSFMRRVAFILLGTGGLASVLAPFYLHRVPTATELLLVTAVAVLRITDMMKVHSGRVTVQTTLTAKTSKPPYHNPGPIAQRKDL